MASSGDKDRIWKNIYDNYDIFTAKERELRRPRRWGNSITWEEAYEKLTKNWGEGKGAKSKIWKRFVRESKSEIRNSIKKEMTRQ